MDIPKGYSSLGGCVISAYSKEDVLKQVNDLREEYASQSNGKKVIANIVPDPEECKYIRPESFFVYLFIAD